MGNQSDTVNNHELDVTPMPISDTGSTGGNVPRGGDTVQPATQPTQENPMLGDSSTSTNSSIYELASSSQNGLSGSDMQILDLGVGQELGPDWAEAMSEITTKEQELDAKMAQLQATVDLYGSIVDPIIERGKTGMDKLRAAFDLATHGEKGIETAKSDAITKIGEMLGKQSENMKAARDDALTAIRNAETTALNEIFRILYPRGILME